MLVLIGNEHKCVIFERSYTVWIDGSTPDTFVKEADPKGADCKVILDVIKVAIPVHDA